MRTASLIVALALVVGLGSPALALAGHRDGPPLPTPVLSPLDVRLMRATKIVFADMDAFRWARRAVRYVAGIHDFMADVPPRPYGEYRFHPRQLESRIRFAKAVVLAFAADDVVDPSITFPDLHPADPRFRYANVAVHRGWMRVDTRGRFLLAAPVRTVDVHRALVLALGLQPAADALDGLHTTRGHTFDTPRDFGTTLLGMRLHLRFNNWSDESQDVGPHTALNRAQVAYSVFRALTEPPRAVPDLLLEYSAISLPALTAQVTRLVQWGIRFVGYPYVWGGEWGKTSPEPHTLGGQPIPGFDCSGFTWWVLRANNPSSGWRVAPPRPYHGWSLPQRTSREMGSIGNLKWRQLRPGDIALYREEGVIGHVDVYIGNGYALDTSSTPAGVTIMWIGSGWHRNHFVHGRRIITASRAFHRVGASVGSAHGVRRCAGPDPYVPAFPCAAQRSRVVPGTPRGLRAYWLEPALALVEALGPKL